MKRLLNFFQTALEKILGDTPANNFNKKEIYDNFIINLIKLFEKIDFKDFKKFKFLKFTAQSELRTIFLNF